MGKWSLIYHSGNSGQFTEILKEYMNIILSNPSNTNNILLKQSRQNLTAKGMTTRAFACKGNGIVSEINVPISSLWINHWKLGQKSQPKHLVPPRSIQIRLFPALLLPIPNITISFVPTPDRWNAECFITHGFALSEKISWAIGVWYSH